MNIPPEYLNQIVTGDARELAKRIPDESVDLILCDPIYWQIEDYRWLAELGRRVLKPFGYCIAEAGTLYAFECMKAMADHLDYYWLISERLTYTAPMFARRVAMMHKPYLWFAKGIENCPKRRFALDGIGSPKDKTWHEWGDGAASMMMLLDRLTERGDLVLDPFTGGGTVPAVCKALGRNYVAFEIDAATAERARERVTHTQMPLFVTEPQQLALDVQPVKV